MRTLSAPPGRWEGRAGRSGTSAAPELRERVGVVPESARRRSLHVIDEIGRSLEAREAWLAGDAAALGRLMNRSHESLRDLYEVSCPEIDWLVKRLQESDHVVGARMSGEDSAGAWSRWRNPTPEAVPPPVRGIRKDLRVQGRTHGVPSLGRSARPYACPKPYRKLRWTGARLWPGRGGVARNVSRSRPRGGTLTEALSEGLRLYHGGAYEQALYFLEDIDPLEVPEAAYYQALFVLKNWAGPSPPWRPSAWSLCRKRTS